MPRVAFATVNTFRLPLPDNELSSNSLTAQRAPDEGRGDYSPTWLKLAATTSPLASIGNLEQEQGRWRMFEEIEKASDGRDPGVDAVPRSDLELADADVENLVAAVMARLMKFRAELVSGQYPASFLHDSLDVTERTDGIQASKRRCSCRMAIRHSWLVTEPSYARRFRFPARITSSERWPRTVSWTCATTAPNSPGRCADLATGCRSNCMGSRHSSDTRTINSIWRTTWRIVCPGSTE